MEVMVDQQFSYSDLKAYLMIFAAFADNELSEKEKEFIISKVGKPEFQKMLKVYKDDSDLEAISRVEQLRNEFFPGEKGKENLLNLITEVFNCDHEFDALENMVYHGIRELL